MSRRQATAGADTRRPPYPLVLPAGPCSPSSASRSGYGYWRCGACMAWLPADVDRTHCGPCALPCVGSFLSGSPFVSRADGAAHVAGCRACAACLFPDHAPSVPVLFLRGPLDGMVSLLDPRTQAFPAPPGYPVGSRGTEVPIDDAMVGVMPTGTGFA